MTERDLAELYERRAEQFARRNRAQAARSSELSVLVFKVGKETYGIDVRELAGIQSYQGSTPVPDAPAGLLGLINVRGDIRPVLDVARVLKLEPENVETGYVLMVRTQGSIMGFKVDRIEQIRDLERREIRTETDSRHLKGITADTLMLIDSDRVAQQLEE